MVATTTMVMPLGMLIMFILGATVAFFGILALVTILRVWRVDDDATR